ncbi:unnamed protein product [Acanthoscelides obtectus]|uniref:C3H1-type domain-containing protein n=1 Tax=Acanthoscelides obtectus TaxID=200917 RepID=A0A9P0NVT9_ACAOB|nr:unnamed protein product [Acanthoscelides obtectus]CAK1667266.1 Zinc finger CCCH domain-containing protein 18 [Acanthoscelides obtectus]
MESEDSRDDSSGSESNDEGPNSPDSGKSDYDADDGKSDKSRSRSGSSSSSRPVSAQSHRSSESSPEGKKYGRNNIKSPGSERSRSTSSEKSGQSRSSSPEQKDEAASSTEEENKLPRKSRAEERSRSSSVEDDNARSRSSSPEVEESQVKHGSIVKQQSRLSSLEDKVQDSKSSKVMKEGKATIKDEQTTGSVYLEDQLQSRSAFEEAESKVTQKTVEHSSLSPEVRKSTRSRSSSIENENVHSSSGSSDKLKTRSRSSSIEKESLKNTPNEKLHGRSNSFEKEKIRSGPSSLDKNDRSSDREIRSRSSSLDKQEYQSNPVEINDIPRKSNSDETVAIFDRPVPVEKKNIKITLLNNIEVGRPQSPPNDSPHSPPYPDREQIRSPDPPKSPDESHSSRSSSPDHHSGQKYRSFKSGGDYRKCRGSRRSGGSRGRSKSSSSDSSNSSVDSSSRKNKNFGKNADTMPEAISDGDMEIEQEKDTAKGKEKTGQPKSGNEINISHEDLSDVSDLEDSMGAHFDQEDSRDKHKRDNNEGRQYHHIDDKPNSKSPVNQDGLAKKVDSNSRQDEAEEQLDFEAEDGECGETDNKDEAEERAAKEAEEKRKEEEERKKKEREDLEEGEVTDEDDVRPEETEPRPVCRFFSRGQCTWGASCRFLHPGVTDKGNYTMFDLVRPLMPGEFRDDRMYVGAKIEPPVVESAWERGLRTAKEMVRKSLKRKEQDMDFEEKKMNLSLAQEEFDKENGYYGRVPSPEPRYVRHVEYPPMTRPPPPDDYYAPVVMPPRRHVMYEPEYMGRERPSRGPYREPPVAAPPPHRGAPPSHHTSHHPPDYYADEGRGSESIREKRERPPPVGHPGLPGERSSRAHAPVPEGRSKREVIVQRAEEVRGRGDEWQDPWMRLKSPAGRRNKERKRSYSSGSSYSSSRYVRRWPFESSRDHLKTQTFDILSVYTIQFLSNNTIV